MSHRSRLFPLVLFVFAICIALSGCASSGGPRHLATTPAPAPSSSGTAPSSSTAPSTPVLPDDVDYSLIQIDGTWFLQFDDISLYATSTPSTPYSTPHSRFHSLDELKSQILQGTLTEEYKRKLVANLDCTDNGIRLPFDFGVTYMPVLPEDFIILDAVSLAEDYYRYSFRSKYIYFKPANEFCITNEEYFSLYRAQVIKKMDQSKYPGFLYSETEQLENGITVTYYMFSSSMSYMHMTYTTTSGSKTCEAHSLYRFRSEYREYGVDYILMKHTYDLSLRFYSDNGLYYFVRFGDNAWYPDFFYPDIGITEYQEDIMYPPVDPTIPTDPTEATRPLPFETPGPPPKPTGP